MNKTIREEKCENCEEQKSITETIFFVDDREEKIYTENLCHDCIVHLTNDDLAFGTKKLAERELDRIVQYKTEREMYDTYSTY